MSEKLSTLNRDLDKITGEIEKINQRWEGKRMGESEDGRADAKKRDELAREAMGLQEEIESEVKAHQVLARGRQLREVPDPTLPSAGNQQGKGAQPTDREVAGYVSLGDMVIASEAFQEFAKTGYARGHVAVIQLAHAAMMGKNVQQGYHGEPLVPLTRTQRKMFEDFMRSPQSKAVPTIGSGVIDPDRLARLPQVTADQRLNIRDVMSSGRTTSNAVEYVREEGVTGNAGVQTPGQPKAELAVEYSLQSAPVRTIAGWMPVQNQQLEDWAQLRGLLDGRLRYKVQLKEEQSIMYGTGIGLELEGILNVTGIQDIAANGRYNGSTHTLIDVVRMGITDIFVAGYQANVVFCDPRDWETILLEKGSDDRYVWAVVTTDNGSRLWGLRVVESVGMESKVAGEVGRREVLVADSNMGAQIIDRMDLTVQVGLVDDQLIRNMRTILAEERIALPIYAPKAFAHFTTETGGS